MIRSSFVKFAVNGCLPIAISLAVLLAGCVQPVDNSGGKKPDGRTVHPPSGSLAALEDACFESFQERDRLRAKMLPEIKSLKYDVNRQKAIEKIGAEASRQTWEPVAKLLDEILRDVPQDDTEKWGQVVDAVARGAERAGK